MPFGISYIPELRLVRLQKLITSFMTPPNMVFSNYFGDIYSDSDTIAWESQIGNRGMTPFVAPGTEAPLTAPIGVARHSATAAYWKEKIPYSEAFLNNLRKEGTESQYFSAKQRLARDMKMLRNRSDRRKEWMFSQMVTGGSVSYSAEGGIKISVDYDLDSSLNVTLASDYKWSTGSNRNIVKDIMDAKIAVQKKKGVAPDTAIFTTSVLKHMALDPGIQTLLAKNGYGDGDLFKRVGGSIIGANTKALGSLLDIPNMVVYDEQYVVRAFLTTNVTASDTTLYIDDVTDFEVGDTLEIHDVSAGTSEEVTISAVNVESGTLTVSAVSSAYKAYEDQVTATRYFVPEDKFILFCSNVEGERIAKFMNAPFGLGRHWGVSAKSWTTEDPEVYWIMVENKGLPVLYHRDAIYNLTVA